jgi:hypothetical protein
MDETRDTLDQTFTVEVHQETERGGEQSQIGDDLSLMNRSSLFD